MGEGLPNPVLQVKDTIAITAMRGPDGMRDGGHAREVGGQVVVEAVGDVTAQLLNEPGSNLLETFRLSLRLLRAVLGAADQDPGGGE